ncbi:MAG: hypothetical protein ACRDOK_11745 [Streptosporangiaceae bacterium]
MSDGALEQQLNGAAAAGGRAAVIFGSVHGDGLRSRLAEIARAAGMALCGAGCMGFANVSHGLRALGYTEPDPLPAGPVALVTHSGSVFSALLRGRRGFGFTLAVSSGQEIVTAAPSFLEYALDLPDTGVLALVLETIRDGDGLRRILGRAAEQDVPVVLLSVGSSAGGQAMVAAHSGALVGSDGSWEALARAYGVHRVGDLAELADTVELFAAGRRACMPSVAGSGIATVHDSELERAHVVDVADSVGIPFAQIGPPTVARLDPGLTPGNPLDVWGTGAGPRELFGGALVALAEDPAWQPRHSPSIWCPSWTATSPIRSPCWMLRDAPASRSRCSAISAAPSTLAGPTGSARAASRCSRAPGPDCGRCGTCSTTRG